MNDHEKLIQEWVNFAEMDLLTAKHLDKTMYPQPLAIICYHCQQAIEKILKAALIKFGIEIKDCTIFALNKDNEVCGFSEDELELGFTVDDPDSLEAPEKEQLVAKLKSMGYTYLSCDNAFKRLSTEADIDYETCYYG